MLLVALDKSCWPSQEIARSIWLLINQCNPRQEGTEINVEAVVPGINDEDQRTSSLRLYPGSNMPCSLPATCLSAILPLISPNALGKTLAWRGHLSWCQASMLGLHNNSWKGLLEQILPEVPRAATIPAAQEQLHCIPASVLCSIFQPPGPGAEGLCSLQVSGKRHVQEARAHNTKGPKHSQTILDSFSQNYTWMKKNQNFHFSLFFLTIHCLILCPCLS